MDTGAHTYSRRLDTKHVVMARRKSVQSMSAGLHRSLILRRDQINSIQDRRMTIGGDPDNPQAQDSPAIVIEEDRGRIVSIMVSCPCGRHAEVECEDGA